MPVTTEQLRQLHRQIDTPALLIFENRLRRNLRAMQQVADQAGAALRPHTKTHKSVDLARWQIETGARGITVAKLSEAQVMIDAGINDVFIANQITHSLKIRKLRELHERARLIVGLDGEEQIPLLEKEFASVRKPLEVRIEIDSGLQRCGVPVGPALIRLAKAVVRRPWLRLEGIFTHAGQVYQAHSTEEVQRIGQQEGEIMSRAKHLLAGEGIKLQTVSVGSTPTAPFSAQNADVNEIRPGNYIFYDAMQMHIHDVPTERCSLFVLATTVSQPEPTRMVIDAGSKALHSDGASLTGHFGLPLNLNALVERLSEEHGILKLNVPQNVAPGEPVLLIPNHACVVVNLFNAFYLIDEQMRIRSIPISARGKSQ